MLKKLRRRLSVIFTAFTGAVLSLVLGISLYFSLEQAWLENEMRFGMAVNAATNSVFSYMVSQEPVRLYTGGYFVVVRGPRQMVIPVREEGATHSLSPAQEDRLFEMAKEEVRLMEEEFYETDMNSGLKEMYITGDGIMMGGVVTTDGTQSGPEAEVQPEEGSAIAVSMGMEGSGLDPVFKLDGKEYRASYLNITVPLDAEDEDSLVGLEIMVAEPMDAYKRQQMLLVLLYVLLFAGGLGLLFVINWQVARLVLRSTEESLRRQTEFVAAASHELRSPLAAIRASLSAAQSAADAADKEKYQSAAASEAERMSRLVGDLLLLAGGDAGSWQLERQPVDVDALLIDAAEAYRPLAKMQQVALDLQLPEETLPPVLGDAERVRQIVSVLLDNALQYAPAHTAVVLAARSRRGRVYIEVADRGKGIAEADRDKVFQRFYRADASRHDKSHFGLGLSVAKELAHLHGGDITVQDTPKGGATFVLSLPAAKTGPNTA